MLLCAWDQDWEWRENLPSHWAWREGHGPGIGRGRGLGATVQGMSSDLENLG